MIIINYDIIGFGKALYNIRSNMDLTIEEAGFLAEVSEKTIYRLEYGKNKASKRTLDLLSNIYKVDLFSLLYKYSDNPHLKWNRIVKTTETQLYIDDAEGISYKINELRKLPLNKFNLFEETNIRHFTSLLEATYSDIKEQTSSSSIQILEKSLKDNIEYFNLRNYKNYSFSPMEIRLIMNLAILKYKTTNNKIYSDILSHLLTLNLNDRVITPKIILNLASIHHTNNEHTKVLGLVEHGIEYCIMNKNLQALPKLYFRKFTSELNLGFKSHLESLNNALFIAEINDQEFLKRQFIASANKHYNMGLDY